MQGLGPGSDFRTTITMNKNRFLVRPQRKDAAPVLAGRLPILGELKKPQKKHGPKVEVTGSAAVVLWRNPVDLSTMTELLLSFKSQLLISAIITRNPFARLHRGQKYVDRDGTVHKARIIHLRK